MITDLQIECVFMYKENEWDVDSSLINTKSRGVREKYTFLKLLK